MSFKIVLPALLLTVLAGPLVAQPPGMVSTQDSAGIGLPELMAAEKLFDLRFTPVKRDSILSGLIDNLHFYQYLHAHPLYNDVPLSMSFDPLLPGTAYDRRQNPLHWDIPGEVSLPANRNDLAYYSIPELASLLRRRKITSVELTQFFIERLKKYGSILHCVIQLTEDSALAQARWADAQFAKGVYRSPLQGIPYGIKDLFAVKGTNTTWGTPPYKDQVIDANAYVAERLDDAGAVLVAKLSLGELAMDDVWFGGLTRNPWNLAVGSGGSSAGSAAATAAGLVPFAIGTETYGSIVDPSMRCGATGLRPTFGSIARTGCMALCWSSDKVGPICRSAEDAAIVFAYIHGGDSVDASSRFMPFNYTGKVDVTRLKVAYTRNYIDTLPDDSPAKQTLLILRKMGVKLIAVDFPDDLRGNDILTLIIGVESAAAFDKLTRTNQDDEMVQQNKDRWPNVFRTARFVPAVEYVNACRMRTAIRQKVDPFISQYDIIIAPPETGDQLAITNLTGHPSVTLPVGYRPDGTPGSISFIGQLYGEARLLAFAKAFQDATPYNKQHPKGFE
ncbi:amidase [Puia dinghuensis]|uniref:Amidase n=1 Tax=Puia dinghuensis TaxID=1792502 RepID=A0A8J2XSY4_9BACT|nr:amidase [Puia dinghuensis]GGA98947.1 amidase [Puia dinghuensis]